MKSIKALAITAFLFLAGGLNVFAQEDLAGLVNDTNYETKADSLEYSLIENFMNKPKGIFWGTPKDVSGNSWNLYWQQAYAIDVITTAYERLKDTDTEKAAKYKDYMKLWYNNHAGNYAGQTWQNNFNDDMAWIALAIVHMGEATDNSSYKRTAKSIYDSYLRKRSVQDETGLWLAQTNDGKTGPGTCTMAPTCLLACRLYEIYGTESYLSDAIAYFDYMKKNFFASDGRCEEPPLTYTQGTAGEAARHLYHLTGTRDYKSKAALYINFGLTSGRCTHNEILRDEGHDMNQAIFKAGLIPYAVNFVLDTEMTLTVRKKAMNVLLNNADVLWANLYLETYPQLYVNYYWAEPVSRTDVPSMGAMVSGCSLMENVARMNRTINDAVAGIDIVQVDEEAQVVDNNYYDLQGRKVENPAGGLYIHNGKKIVVR